jgi:hypothetical protein
VLLWEPTEVAPAVHIDGRRPQRMTSQMSPKPFSPPVSHIADNLFQDQEHGQTSGFKRIPQSKQKCQKRGGILEQRRRPTVKFQSDFALSQVVAVRFKHSLEAPLSDVCSEAETHRLRCGRIVPRAFCQSQLRNPS